jgi:uncharacterized protein (TIGR02145 family)
MKRPLLSIFLIVLNSGFLFSQDVIYLIDGTEISSKVVEIDDMNVIYKNFDQPEGININLPKSDIFMIVYQDGKVEKFKTQASEINKTESTPSNSITDADGNKYATVIIGTQTWMAENLKTTQYINNGGFAYTAEANNIWANTYNPCYCWYNNESKNKEIYGALYNWPAISIEGLCPSGWHVPSEDDLTVLVNFLGGEDVAGGKLKEQGTVHWESPNTGATNESGFGALPGGWRNFAIGAAFDMEGEYSVWWLSTRKRGLFGCGFSLDRKSTKVKSGCYLSKKEGAYVRCVKD